MRDETAKMKTGYGMTEFYWRDAGYYKYFSGNGICQIILTNGMQDKKRKITHYGRYAENCDS